MRYMTSTIMNVMYNMKQVCYMIFDMWLYDANDGYGYDVHVDIRMLLELRCPGQGFRGTYRGGTSPSRDRLPNVNDANVN